MMERISAPLFGLECAIKRLEKGTKSPVLLQQFEKWCASLHEVLVAEKCLSHQSQVFSLFERSLDLLDQYETNEHFLRGFEALTEALDRFSRGSGDAKLSRKDSTFYRLFALGFEPSRDFRALPFHEWLDQSPVQLNPALVAIRWFYFRKMVSPQVVESLAAEVRAAEERLKENRRKTTIKKTSEDTKDTKETVDDENDEMADERAKEKQKKPTEKKNLRGVMDAAGQKVLEKDQLKSKVKQTVRARASDKQGDKQWSVKTLHVSVTQSVSQSVSSSSRKRKATELEHEKHHYELTEFLCTAAASGQPSLHFKRLRIAEKEGEDITVYTKGKTVSAVEMKRFSLREEKGTPWQRVESLKDEVHQVLHDLLPNETWTGTRSAALIFAHTLYLLEAAFKIGTVDKLIVSPPFPSYSGSKDEALEFYDRGKLLESSDPGVIFNSDPPAAFTGLVSLVFQICKQEQIEIVEAPSFEDYEGQLLDLYNVGENLVYSGRNSVVLSCQQDEELSVVKVGTKTSILLEVSIHRLLDKLPGIRKMSCYGRLRRAGDELWFVQLEGLGITLRRGHFEPGLAQKACDILASVHARGVFHRDIKPSNFILLPKGDHKYQLMLNDFDLACLAEEAQDPEEIVGTPLFMSPLLKGRAYTDLDDWVSLALSFMYLMGLYSEKDASDDSKLLVLAVLLEEEWVPKALKDKVQRFLSERPWMQLQVVG